MKEEFKESSWKDFQQRYQGTYGWYEKDNGQRLLVNLVKVNPDILTFSNAEGFKFTANPDKGNCFTFLPAERGCYEYEDDIIICRRIPQRQWKRGICGDNTSLLSLKYNEHMPVEFGTLQVLFGNKKVSMMEKFKTSLDGNVTLNKSFSIYNRVVRLYEHAIGAYFPEKGITLDSAIFQQEVSDLMTQHKLPISVSVA